MADRYLLLRVLACLLIGLAAGLVVYVGLRYDACDLRPIITTCETGAP